MKPRFNQMTKGNRFILFEIANRTYDFWTRDKSLERTVLYGDLTEMKIRLNLMGFDFNMRKKMIDPATFTKYYVCWKL